eukprot:scaffold135543_cov41-Prasinocladus_malaysianus.AAC.1
MKGYQQCVYECVFVSSVWLPFHAAASSGDKHVSSSYESWFSDFVKGSSESSSAHGAAGTHRTLQVLLMVLSSLVPCDTLGVLQAQQRVLGNLSGQGSEQLRDYLMLVKARVSELKEV